MPSYLDYSPKKDLSANNSNLAQLEKKEALLKEYDRVYPNSPKGRQPLVAQIEGLKKTIKENNEKRANEIAAKKGGKRKKTLRARRSKSRRSTVVRRRR